MEKILNDLVDKYFGNMVEDLKEFIKIPSVLDENTANDSKPFGEDLFQAMDWFIKKGQSFGFKVKNIDNYAGFCEVGNGEKMVGILGHLDVVPAGDGWIVPPFEGRIIDNKLYGRGSVDDKGPTLAVLYALKAIKESKLPTKKRARLIVGADEETLGRCMKHYLEVEESPEYGFSPDAEFPIIYSEKGILRFEFRKCFKNLNGNELKYIKGGTRVNVVPDHAEARLVNSYDDLIKKIIKDSEFKDRISLRDEGEDIIISVRGISSHASYPQAGLNAIQIILNILSNIDFKDEGISIYIKFLSYILGMDYNGEKIGISCKDDISGELTFNPGVIDYDNNCFILKFDVRYPVKVNAENIIEKLREIAIYTGSDFNINQHKPPLYVDKDKEFIKKLQKVYNEMTGEEAKLISIGGGTYCRYVKNTVSFGPVFPGQKELAHQKDEFINIEDFRKISKIYVQAIYELIK